MERLHGFDHEATSTFVHGWHNHTLIVNGASFPIIEEFIAQLIGLSMDGRNFFKEQKGNEDAMEQFFNVDVLAMGDILLSKSK